MYSTFDYSAKVDVEYFAENRSILKQWFINNGLHSEWCCIGRYLMDYIVHFHKEEHMFLFILTFETKPWIDLDT